MCSFLCDITSHLNHLNLQLQGKNHTVADMYEEGEAFRSKLNLLGQDNLERKLNFPRLREHCEKNEMQEDAVIKDFVTSSPEFSNHILLFLRQPFSVSTERG